MDTEIHPNRNLFYFVGLSSILLLGVFWYSQMFVIEEENTVIERVYDTTQQGSISEIILGTPTSTTEVVAEE